MQERIYLLDLSELEGQQDSPLFQRAMDMLDEERLAKALRIHSASGQAAGLGAGLLIQMAVAERELPTAVFRCFQAEELLEALECAAGGNIPAPLAYRYGEHGKPYLRDVPLQFSLSHSGRFVLCAVSEGEIGADIQQMRPLTDFHVAERFFTPREVDEILQSGEHAQREQAFYRIWVRKEAYGKLTGEGIVAAAGQDLEELGQRVVWEQMPEPEGYQIAICRYGTEQA